MTKQQQIEFRERRERNRRLSERDRRYAANNPDALAPTRGRVPGCHTGTIRDTWSRWH